jgi:hypothetical protein
MSPRRGKVLGIRREGSNGLGPSIEARMSQGKALRERISRTSHAEWAAPSARPDLIKVLQHSDRGRVPELLPIRYGRMQQSPFAFFRGAAAVMAWDLSRTPATGIRVQACGDCHAANFGGFASPERRLLFDINDFDETLSAPWEWDVKRLAASVVLASREIGMGGGRCGDAVLSVFVPRLAAIPICNADPNTVPKAMDVLTPSGVSQSDELDYTVHNPVTLQDVVIP